MSYSFPDDWEGEEDAVRKHRTATLDPEPRVPSSIEVTASQRDADLVNFIGDLNHPETATRAGEALSLAKDVDSEAGDGIYIKVKDGYQQQDDELAVLTDFR